MATQIALGAAVLVVTVLVVQSLGNLETGTVPDSDRVLTANVTLFGTEPPAAEVRGARWGELEARLRRDPRIREMALSSALPGSNLPESRASRPEDSASTFPLRQVLTTAALFRLLGIPVLHGQGFEPGSGRGEGEPVAVVSRALAVTAFPGADPLGRLLVLDPGTEWETRVRVVGVAGDLPMGRLEGDDRKIVYLRWPGQAAPTWAWVALRAQGDPMVLAASLREAVAGLAPDQSVTALGTLDGALAEAAFRYRFSGVLFVLFGALAVFLAALGLYAVMSFHVGRRAHEMGVRLAVGARRSDLLALVLRGGLNQVGLGLFPGLALGMLFARWMSTFLYRVESTGLPALALVATTLLTAGLLACRFPARRAAKADPIAALRAE